MLQCALQANGDVAIVDVSAYMERRASASASAAQAAKGLARRLAQAHTQAGGDDVAAGARDQQQYSEDALIKMQLDAMYSLP